jgi:hypothetical protein
VRRDGFRAEVAELIRNKITESTLYWRRLVCWREVDEHTINAYGELPKIPRKTGTLIAELEKRKLRWKTPADWPQDLPGIEKLVTSRAVDDLKKVKEAFEDGSLQLISGS